MSSQIPLFRWFVKKSSRKIVTISTYPQKYIKNSFVKSTEPNIRILTYHRFGDIPYDPFCVTTKDFESQIKWLAENQAAISLNDVEDFINGNKLLTDGSVLVTIDDGYRSTYSHALPILREYNVPAVAFVSAGIIDGSLKANDQIEPYLSLDELKTLAKEGVTIGSHSYSHLSLGKIDPAEVQNEAYKSRELLEQHIDQPVTSFAYPFGTITDFNKDTAKILKECGYTSVYTSQHGSIHPGMNAYELPRIKIEGGEPLWMFRMLCQGGMDAWGLIDNILFRLQKPNQ